MKQEEEKKEEEREIVYRTVPLAYQLFTFHRADDEE